MGRIEVLLRRTELSLQELDLPKTCASDFHGDLRTLSPTAKVRELENLTARVSEIQFLINENGENESHQCWLDGLKQSLKERVALIFEPQQIVVGGKNG